jgi:hypothetical protein
VNLDQRIAAILPALRVRGMLNELKVGDPVVLQLEHRGGLMYLAFTIE